MITVEFQEFFNKGQDILYKYDNLPTIYIVRLPSGDLLYVGKSVSIYDRWFDQTSSHMVSMSDENGEWIFGGRSSIGAAIVSNLPESNKWLFDLWTTKEALEFLGFETYEGNRKNNSDNRGYVFAKPVSPYFLKLKEGVFRTEDAEAWLTAFLHPKYNSHNNNGYRHEDLYQKYFEFIKGWELVR